MDAKPRKDRDGRREAILDVAADVFLEVGYSAASMSAIAARVGGSKGTLYNYFKSKEDLFSAYVERHCAWQQETMNELAAQTSDTREAMTVLGRALLRVVVTGIGRRNFSLIVAEADRAPEIGVAFYESGPKRGAALVAHRIERGVADGDLRPCDPVVAAHQFIGMCQNRLFKARICGYAAEPCDAEIEAEVLAAVETFMSAFGAPRRGEAEAA